MRRTRLLGIAILAVTLWVGTQSVAAHRQESDTLTLLHLKKHQPYSQARPKMLKDGWKPLLSEKGRGFTAELLQAGWVEVSNCSGTGLGFCTFDWKRRNQCARVITYGEYLPERGSPKVSSAKVGNCTKVLTN